MPAAFGAAAARRGFAVAATVVADPGFRASFYFAMMPPRHHCGDPHDNYDADGTALRCNLGVGYPTFLNFRLCKFNSHISIYDHYLDSTYGVVGMILIY